LESISKYTRTSKSFQLFILVAVTFSLAQSLSAQKSIAFLTGTGLPVSGLNDWYSATPVIGLQYVISTDEITKVVMEFHYQNYSGGSIADRKFRWVVDYDNYKSPAADANMNWNDFIIKTRKYFPNNTRSFAGKILQPFASYGLGLYNYTHQVSGLIYPGQSKKPLDTEYLLDPITDRRVAWGGNIGVGFDSSLGQNVSLALDLTYNAAIGYLRSFEDWGLKEVMPLQFLTIGIGFNYNY
jgi:hypothetical protein